MIRKMMWAVLAVGLAMIVTPLLMGLPDKVLAIVLTKTTGHYKPDELQMLVCSNTGCDEESAALQLGIHILRL